MHIVKHVFKCNTEYNNEHKWLVYILFLPVSYQHDNSRIAKKVTASISTLLDVDADGERFLTRGPHQ